MTRTSLPILKDFSDIDKSSVLRGAAVGWILAVLLFQGCTGLGWSARAAHILALAASCLLIFYVLLQRRSTAESTRSGAVLTAFRLLVSYALAVSLQGAVLLHLQQLVPLPAPVAFALAALAGVSSFSLVSLVWAAPPSDSGPVAKETVLSVFIAAMIVLRLVYLGLPELMEQEAYYWNYAQHPDLSYLDHPPMVALLIWLGTWLFGVSEFGVRIGAQLCWGVAAYFSYRLARALFGRQAALGALLLFAVLPLYFGVGFLMTPDAPLHAAWSALLFFGYRALLENDPRSWVGFGISLGLGMLSKYTIVLLGPAFLLFMLVDRSARKWFFRPGPYVALALALLLFTPVLIWNMQHGWASFLFQSAKRISSVPVISTHHLIGHVALMLTPAGLIGVLLFFFFGRKIMGSAQADETPETVQQTRRRFLLLFLTSFLPCALFVVVSLGREVKLNWTSPLWLALLPFLGCTVSAVYGRFCSICMMVVQELWRVTIPLLILVYALGLHFVTLGFPGLAHPPGPFLIGWDQLAARVEKLADEIERESGSRPLVVGMDHYQIASGLAFYRTKNAIENAGPDPSVTIDQSVGWHLFGHNSRMYRLWFDVQDWQPVAVIAVSSKRSRLEEKAFNTEVVFDSEILPLPAVKEGQVVRPFYYRLVSSATFK